MSLRTSSSPTRSAGAEQLGVDLPVAGGAVEGLEQGTDLLGEQLVIPKSGAGRPAPPLVEARLGHLQQRAHPRHRRVVCRLRGSRARSASVNQRRALRICSNPRHRPNLVDWLFSATARSGLNAAGSGRGQLPVEVTASSMAASAPGRPSSARRVDWLFSDPARSGGNAAGSGRGQSRRSATASSMAASASRAGQRRPARVDWLFSDPARSGVNASGRRRPTPGRCDGLGRWRPALPGRPSGGQRGGLVVQRHGEVGVNASGSGGGQSPKSRRPRSMAASAPRAGPAPANAGWTGCSATRRGRG